MSRKIILTLAVVIAFIVIHSVFAQRKNVKYENVNVKEFAKIIKSTGVQLVDVRTMEEYAEGHLQDATQIDVKGDDFLKIAKARLHKNKTIAVYCRSGKRSAHAATLLTEAGYKVVNMEGGFMAWTETFGVQAVDMPSAQSHQQGK